MTSVAVKVPKWAKRLGYTAESFAAWQERHRKQRIKDDKQAKKWKERYEKLPMKKKFVGREMNLSVRARRSLGHLQVQTVGEVAALSESSFALVRNCGPKTVAEIRAELKRLGFDFALE